MTIQTLDHVNIRTEKVAETAAFFRDILGMTVRLPPGSDSVLRAAWVLDETGRAVVHIGGLIAAYPTDSRAPFVPVKGGGSVHHIAFSCSGYAEACERLRQHGITPFENHVSSMNLRQVFVEDPNGILVELNFVTQT